jgi:hypothetical protein
LAAMRCLLDGNIVLFEECPYQIRHLLVSDAMRLARVNALVFGSAFTKKGA